MFGFWKLALVILTHASVHETSSTVRVAVAFGSVGDFLQPRLNSIKLITTNERKFFFIRVFRLRLKGREGKKYRERLTSKELQVESKR